MSRFTLDSKPAEVPRHVAFLNKSDPSAPLFPAVAKVLGFREDWDTGMNLILQSLDGVSIAIPAYKLAAAEPKDQDSAQLVEIAQALKTQLKALNDLKVDGGDRPWHRRRAAIDLENAIENVDWLVRAQEKRA